MPPASKPPRGWQLLRGARGRALWTRKAGNYRVQYHPPSRTGAVHACPQALLPGATFRITAKGELYTVPPDAVFTEGVLRQLDYLQDKVAGLL